MTEKKPVLLSAKKIGFIGGGAMGGALLQGVLSAQLVKPDQVFVSDANTTRLSQLQKDFNIHVTDDNSRLAAECDIVFLTVKPQVISAVLDQLQGIINSEAMVVSIVAGMTISSLEAKLPDGMPVVRVMPNTPALVGAGMAAIAAGRHALDEHMDNVRKIFGAVGQVVEVDEYLMDAVTGLSGSGPAYGYMIIEAMADGGVQMGLPRATAMQLAAQTLLGAAQMVLTTGMHPGVLKDMVTSPAGTTIAAVQTLERHGMRAAFIDAVQAAAERSKELAQK